MPGLAGYRKLSMTVDGAWERDISGQDGWLSTRDIGLDHSCRVE